MTKSSAIADSFARVVFLLRDIPDDREAQKSAFRALLVRVTDQAVRFTVAQGRLLVDGEEVEPETPGTVALRRQLLGHGVGDLSIPPGLNPGQLLTVIRAIAAPAGAYPRLQHLSDHFTVAGVDGVKISAPEAPASVVAPTEASPRQTPPSRPAILTEPAPSAPEESEIKALGPDAANEEAVGLLHFVTLELKSLGRLDDLLIELDRNPDSSQAGELLNEVVAFGDTAMQTEQWSEVVRVASALVRLEGKTAESQSRLYGIALRRLISKTTLEKIARLLPHSDQRAEVTTVLRRLGADATEILVQLLCSENDVGHRRVYFNAVTQMTEGTELLVHMLGHDEWFVVRNVADLCGEMRLEAAVPALARRLTHSDERVRRAATSALGRIGSAGTMEPLRKALQDTSALVRMQAATSLEGSRARNLVPALSRLVEEETHADVQREMLHALGRIGSPEAIETLIRASQPVRGLFKKKALGLRVEAVEGLRLAGGPAAIAALQDLEKDKEEVIRNAASQALKTALEAPPPKN